MDQASTSPLRLNASSTVDEVETAERPRVIARRPAGEADETYRKAALSLSKMVAGGARSVLFCSARRGEGTTTAVLNLAHQLSESYGLRPLVIELSRRRPALGRLYRLDPERSVDRVLDQSRALAACIQVTASGLSVIPGSVRKGVHAQPQLLSALRRVLAEAEELFDVVLVDAPPVLVQADAIIAGTVVGTLILVVEAGRTSYEVLERVKAELADEDIRIAGTLLVKQKRFIPRWLYWWLSR